MKILLSVVVVLFGLNSSFGNSKNVEEREALANTYGLFIEKLESILEDGSLDEATQGKLKIDIERAEYNINQLEIRRSRMFLNIDINFMCNLLQDRIDENFSQYTSTSDRLSKTPRRARMGSSIAVKRKSLQRKVHRLSNQINFDSRVKEKICVN